MTTRRSMLAVAFIGGVAGSFGGTALLAPLPASSAVEALAAATNDEDTGSALLDRYVAAVNAHDTSSFPELFTESYIQHSGRSPSGLAAQIENFQRVVAAMPDVAMQVEDRIVSGDRVVARTTWSATHTQTIFGFAPTGKSFTFRAFDIWRVEGEKFAEHWDITDAEAVLRQLSNSS